VPDIPRVRDLLNELARRGEIALDALP